MKKVKYSKLVRVALIVGFAVGLATSATAGGKKEQAFVLSFHLQANNTELNSGSRRVRQVQIEALRFSAPFYVLPEFSNSDIASFFPFVSEDKGSMGVVFNLTDKASRRLFSLSSQQMGRYLIAMYNGTPMELLQIDRPVQDGKIVVWQGFSPADIKLFGEKFAKAKPGQ